jgi:hypothetical protein
MEEKKKYYEYEWRIMPGSKWLGMPMHDIVSGALKKFNQLTVFFNQFDEGLIAKLKEENKDALFIDHIHEEMPTKYNRKRPHKREKIKPNYHIKFISANEKIIDYIKSYI